MGAREGGLERSATQDSRSVMALYICALPMRLLAPTHNERLDSWARIHKDSKNPLRQLLI